MRSKKEKILKKKADEFRKNSEEKTIRDLLDKAQDAQKETNGQAEGTSE